MLTGRHPAQMGATSKEPRNPPLDGAGGWGKPAPGAPERPAAEARPRGDAPRDRARDGDWRAAKEKGGGDPGPPPREWQEGARRGAGAYADGRGAPGSFDVRPRACVPGPARGAWLGARGRARQRGGGGAAAARGAGRAGAMRAPARHLAVARPPASQGGGRANLRHRLPSRAERPGAGRTCCLCCG